MTLTQQDLDKNEFPKFNDIVNLSHDYLVCGDKTKSPVILLHEISGLDEQTIAYASTLAQDFTVYVPRLMGEKESGIGILSGMFNLFKIEWEQQDNLNNSMLITQWLRKFTKKIGNIHHRNNIGIIGNCLTGALPLALLDNTQVTKVVLAQPALPLKTYFGFGDKEDLVISESEWQIAKERLKPTKCPPDRPVAKAYGTRFGLDKKAPIEKYEYLGRELESGFICRQISKSEYTYTNINGQLTQISHCAHSSLIHEWEDDPNHPSQKRRLEVKAFLLNEIDNYEQPLNQ